MKKTPTEQEINDSLKLFVVLSRAARSVADRISENIRSYGLNPTEFAVLEMLYHTGNQPIQVIGKKVLIASSSITYVVDKLEQKGMVNRISSPGDRRVILAAIASDGEKLMDQIFPGHAQAIHAILSGVEADEKRVLIHQLKQIGLTAQRKK